MSFDWSNFHQERWIVTHEFSQFQQKIKIGLLNDERVAIKIGANLDNEIQLMLKIPPHPNIIKFIAMIDDGCILMEGIKDGLTLRDYYETYRSDGKSFTLNQLLDMISQMAQGLNHLHQNRIIHHDFTNRNVLVHFNPNDDSIVLKIADFGVSEFMDENGHGDSKNRELGTWNYMAPEQKASDESISISEKIDCYAFGLICSILVYVGRPNDRVMYCLPNNLDEMIFSCKSVDPNQRPSMMDCIRLIHQSPPLQSLKDQIAEMHSIVLSQPESPHYTKIIEQWNKCKDLIF